jgi:hypothetical protein
VVAYHHGSNVCIALVSLLYLWRFFSWTFFGWIKCLPKCVLCICGYPELFLTKYVLWQNGLLNDDSHSAPCVMTAFLFQ